SVSSAKEGGLPFTMSSSVALQARDICGPRFFLFGGGGCQDIDVTARSSHRASFFGLFGLLAMVLLRRRLRTLTLAIFLGAFLIACNSKAKEEPDRGPPDPIGTPCNLNDDMVLIPSLRGQDPFCIERYEASLMSGDLGNPTQPLAGDGSTTAKVASQR